MMLIRATRKTVGILWSSRLFMANSKAARPPWGPSLGIFPYIFFTSIETGNVPSVCGPSAFIVSKSLRR